jgi:hypothetical protein
VDERILAQRAQHSLTDREDKEKSNCFYCLEDWVFLGRLRHDGEEVVDSIRCRRCGGYRQALAVRRSGADGTDGDAEERIVDYGYDGQEFGSRGE